MCTGDRGEINFMWCKIFYVNNVGINIVSYVQHFYRNDKQVFMIFLFLEITIWF
jgi:hypothetical protein